MQILTVNLSGLYIHVPFCVSKCGYCSFYSVKGDDRIRGIFERALLSELEERVKDIRIGTIYAGGGTPTLLSHEFWSKFLTITSDIADTSAVREVTIETNPGTISERELFRLRLAGFNRLSIGIQSFHDSVLDTLGRIHTSAKAVETFGSARNVGFENISIDLMYGVPGQSLKDWIADLRHIENLAPEHISCYELSVEEGTPIAEAISRGEISKPAKETCRKMYFLADEILKEYGYTHYEVSNYALEKSYISQHNSSYWNRTPYIGLGPSAHSFDGISNRSWNESSLDEYLRRFRNGHSQATASETVSKEQAALEIVMLGLRCNIGIDPDEIVSETGVRLNTDYLNGMIENGKLTHSEARLVPTVKGMLYADGDSVNLIN